jgi:hypothetical protein
LLSGRLFADDSPSFSQKGGMLPEGSHSFYLRTNDEFTSFSTFLAGYRYGLTNFFQLAVEGGVGIGVYIGAVVFHFKIYESPNRFFFIGFRSRNGFKYQDTYINFGNNNVLDDERLGFYFGQDLTFALRFGDNGKMAVYYTLYTLIDTDVQDGPPEVYLSPVHIGFEVRFGKRDRWSFAIETGYFFPINDVADTSWVNFPNLGNMGLYYSF